MDYYMNDEVYEGHWLKGKKSGSGKYTYNNGDIYEGQWLNGQRNGLG